MKFLKCLLIMAMLLNSALTLAAPMERAGQLSAISALRFESNVGQAGTTSATFIAHAGGSSALLGPGYIELSSPDRHAGSPVRLQFLNANLQTKVEGVGRLRLQVNYLRGSRSDWRTGVPTFSAVRYRDLYPGIDLLVHATPDGRNLEYDFEIAPNADLSPVAMRFEPAGQVSLAQDGSDVVVKTSTGQVIRQRAAYAYQKSGDKQVAVPVHYVLQGNVVKIELGSYRRDLALTIDPALIYSTVLNGTTGVAIAGYDPLDVSVIQASATSLDPDGHTYQYVAGSANLYGGGPQSDFPIKNARDATPAVGFIAKLDPTQSGNASAIYVTYFDTDGGGVAALAVDSSGNLYATGSTQDSAFPIVNGYSSSGSGFLTKFSPDGATILYSTRFGVFANPPYGTSTQPSAITTDGSATAYLTGSTYWMGFPLVNSYSVTFGLYSVDGTSVAFVTAFDTSATGPASIVYSTEFGTPGTGANGIAYRNGEIAIVGQTSNSGIPLVNAFNTSKPYSAFIAVLNPSLSEAAQLIYSGYLNFGASSVAFDSAGNVFAAGTAQPNFRTPALTATQGAYQAALGSGQPQGYIAKINPSMSGAASLLALTYLSGREIYTGTSVSNIAVASSGAVVVAGTTTSTDFPVLNPVVPGPNGLVLSSDRGHSFHLTGPRNIDSATAIAIDSTTSPRTLYVGTTGPDPYNPAIRWPLMKSIDGGLSWTNTGAGLPAGSGVYSLHIDPSDAQHLYAGVCNGVYVSSDGGGSWTPLGTGLSDCVINMAFDDGPNGNGNIYAAGRNSTYALASSQSTWRTIAQAGYSDGMAIDNTANPHLLYIIGSDQQLNVSQDGGATWNDIPWPPQILGPPLTLGLDLTRSPATIYLTDGNDWSVFGSPDKGSTWQTIDCPGNPGNWTTSAHVFAFDPTTSPTTMYATSDDGVFEFDISGTCNKVLHENIGPVAVDPLHSSGAAPVIYAASWGPSSAAFVATLDPTLSTLQSSSEVGSIGGDTYGRTMSVDATGNIYVGGQTRTDQFPTLNAYDAAPIGGIDNGFLSVIGTPTLPASSSGAVTTTVGTGSGSLSLTFPDVTGSTTSTAPTVNVTPLSNTSTANFQLSNNLGAFDIATTAMFDGSVTLCFQVITVNDPATFSNLTLLHVVNGVAVNITSSYDFSRRTICGTTTSFSPFIVVKGAVQQINDLVRYVGNSDLKKGIQTSLDAKLQNAESAYTNATGNNYSNVCNQMSAFLSNVASQTGKALTTSEANYMTMSARQIRATVGCAQ